MEKRSDPSPLRIEIDRGRQPISGRLHVDGGEPVAFEGWLELMAAVELARDPQPETVTSWNRPEPG